MTLFLKLLENSESQEIFNGMTLGRSEKNHCCFDRVSISRRHLRFEVLGQRVFAIDLHSANGVYLNGERIREAEIFPGDKIAVGDLIFLILSDRDSLTLIEEKGPSLPTRDFSVDPVKGWRSMARDFFEALNFIDFSTAALILRSFQGHVIEENIFKGKSVAYSTWILQEARQGALFMTEDLPRHSESLMTRAIQSLAVFPLDQECFFWIESASSLWNPKNFQHLESLVKAFTTPFLTGLSAWCQRRPLPPLMGRDPLFSTCVEKARKIASQNLPLLLSGPSGSGKSLLARWIHEWSPRNDEVCEILDLAALPENLLASSLFGHEAGAFTGAESRREGIFFQANRGSLILENIDEASENSQKFLLRALEEKSFRRLGGQEKLPLDVRLITTSREPLENLVSEGRFREDLYFRLAASHLRLPSLEDRPDDIEMLATFFLEALNQKEKTEKYFSKSFSGFCRQQSWPGQVRELKNFIEFSYYNAETGCIEEKQRGLQEEKKQKFLSLKALEKKQIEKALKLSQGNKGKACELLGITRPTLKKKIEDYRIDDTLGK
jgi:DNA-binding NtrC family response regulator